LERYTAMLRLTLKPSRLLAIALTVVHICAAATLVPLDLPAWAKAGLALAVAASLAQAVLRHALLKGRGCLIAIELREDDRAAVQTRDGTWHDTRVLGTTYVSPLLSVINLRLDGRRFARHMLVVPDNADAEYFRQLRVWLRWGYRNLPSGAAAADAASEARSLRS
jgi:toxin CptA